MKYPFALIFVLTLAMPAFGGNEKGNGGDTVFCTADKERGFVRNGYYFLDYIASLEGSDKSKSRTFSSTALAIHTIQSKVEAIHKSLSAKFEEFFSTLETSKDDRSDNSLHTVQSEHYILQRVGFLMGANGEEDSLLKQLPKNCWGDAEREGAEATAEAAFKSGSLDLIRSFELSPRVKKDHEKKLLQYSYNEDSVDDLGQNDDQLAWAITHEVIWGEFSVIDSKLARNRSFNIFLHSEEFLNAEPEKAKELYEAKVKKLKEL